MPIILAKSDWSLWLGEDEASPADLFALLRPFPAEVMRAYPIGPAVGNVKNDNPALLDPISDEIKAAE
jgi:putative SOS response-associated peptidase YedK